MNPKNRARFILDEKMRAKIYRYKKLDKEINWKTLTTEATMKPAAKKARADKAKKDKAKKAKEDKK
jgi:hypothetical protein